MTQQYTTLSIEFSGWGLPRHERPGIITLAATWMPRGELPRLERLLPELQQIYAGEVLVLPPDTSEELIDALHALGQTKGAHPPVSSGFFSLLVAEDWSCGRHLALRQALLFETDFIHYVDLDRLLRWVETQPEEWRGTVAKIRQSDCLIIGRTAAAYRTHPQALVRTEEISNRVVSTLLGRQVDASAGSKGFSRKAAEFLMANSPPGRALGTDAEWPVLLKRAGFRVEYVAVDGLDWEIPDQYQDQAASPERQAQLAESYDADPQNWARRVEVAGEIVACGLEASTREYDNNRSYDYD